MFEDIIKPKTITKADTDDKLYVCQYSDKCKMQFCLHKVPHRKWELGRPDQDDIDDCTTVSCNEIEGAICIPVN